MPPPPHAHRVGCAHRRPPAAGGVRVRQDQACGVAAESAPEFYENATVSSFSLPLFSTSFSFIAFPPLLCFVIYRLLQHAKCGDGDAGGGLHRVTGFLFSECNDKFCAALKEDLGRSLEEGYLTEVNPVEQQVQSCLDHLDQWMAPEQVLIDPVNIPGTAYIKPEPLGVALVIGAWNYPIHLTLMPVVGAIAAGNCCCIKVPSDKYSAASSRAVAECLPLYLDPECFAVIQGDRHATQAVLQHKWDIIFYTGGCYVGQMVAEAAAKFLTPTVLELGGKSPCIVDSSADIVIACKRIVWGGFFNSGQTCVRPDYLLVEEAIADTFVAQLKLTIEKFYGENPSESNWYGRLINDRAFSRVADLINASRNYIKIGGEVDASQKFVSPTVVDFGTDFEAFKSSAVMKDELFAPILPLYRYISLDKALSFVRAGDKPLCLYGFSTDAAAQERLLNETSSGAVIFNDTLMHLASHKLPFGGVGKSGMGRYHGKFSFDTFSHSKPVLQKYNYLDIDFPFASRYPPYSRSDINFLNFVQSPKPSWVNDAIVQIPRYALIAMALYFLRSTGMLRQVLLALAELF